MQAQINEIRSDLKAMGYTSRMIGVAKRNTPSYEVIALIVKTSEVTPHQAYALAKKYEEKHGVNVISFN